MDVNQVIEERSAEYLLFMDELESFNSKLGVKLQREPYLGGKNLDMFQVYKSVLEAGGYEKVSQERKWKQITTPFNLSATCTNAAYVVKQLYQKYLYKYEMVKERGMSIKDVPKFTQDDEDEESDETMVDLASLSASIDGKQGNVVQVTLPTVPESLKSAANVLKLQASAVSMTEAEGREDIYLVGGPKSRLLLALESKLPNEVDWAFNKLVKISFTCPTNFHISILPNLVDALIIHINQLFDLLSLKPNLNDYETDVSLTIFPMGLTPVSLLNSFEFELLVERALQSLHVIRNLSHMEQNAAFFATNQELIIILFKGIALPSSSFFIELKQHCLEISENLAKYLQTRGKNDFLFRIFIDLVYDSDRSHILTSIRSLTSMCTIDDNNDLIEEIEDKYFARLLDLLLVPDEELVNVILELLYQFSIINPDILARVCLVDCGNFVKFLCKFVHWRGFPQPLAQPRAAGVAALNGPALSKLLDKNGRPLPPPPKPEFIEEPKQTPLIIPQSSPALRNQRGPPMARPPSNGFYHHEQMARMAMPPQHMQMPPQHMQMPPHHMQMPPQHMQMPPGQMMMPPMLMQMAPPVFRPIPTESPSNPTLNRSIRSSASKKKVKESTSNEEASDDDDEWQGDSEDEMDQDDDDEYNPSEAPRFDPVAASSKTMLQRPPLLLMNQHQMMNMAGFRPHMMTPQQMPRPAMAFIPSTRPSPQFMVNQTVSRPTSQPSTAHKPPVVPPTVASQNVIKQSSIAGHGPASRPSSASANVTLTGIPLIAILVLRNLARAAKKLGDSEEGSQLKNMFVECEGDLAIITSIDVRFSQFVAQILAELCLF